MLEPSVPNKDGKKKLFHFTIIGMIFSAQLNRKVGTMHRVSEKCIVSSKISESLIEVRLSAFRRPLFPLQLGSYHQIFCHELIFFIWEFFQGGGEDSAPAWARPE